MSQLACFSLLRQGCFPCTTRGRAHLLILRLWQPQAKHAHSNTTPTNRIFWLLHRCARNDRRKHMRLILLNLAPLSQWTRLLSSPQLLLHSTISPLDTHTYSSLCLLTLIDVTRLLPLAPSSPCLREWWRRCGEPFLTCRRRWQRKTGRWIVA